MCTVNITATAITFHMYHSIYATHLNYTFTQIHITAQAQIHIYSNHYESTLHMHTLHSNSYESTAV